MEATYQLRRDRWLPIDSFILPCKRISRSLLSLLQEKRTISAKIISPIRSIAHILYD